MEGSSMMLRPWVGLGPAPIIFACLFCLSLKQVIGSRCTPGVTHDGLGYKSPDQMAVWRALGWSLDLDRDWIWIVVGWSIVGFGLSSSFVYITLYLTLQYIFCFSSQH